MKESLTMRTVRFLVVAPILLLLAACASNFQADVSRFHRLEKPTGQTIRIAPLDERKEGSLEFQTYASMIAPELDRLGYMVVGPNDPSQLIAKIDYEVDDGNTVVRSYPNHFPRFYGYYNPWYSPWYGYGPYDYGTDIRSYIVYPRQLDLQIVRADVKPTDPSYMLYEGHARSQGTSDRLPEVMPLLIKALFTDFPGDSGATETVSIPLK